MTFNEIIRQLRQKKKWSEYDLAKNINKSAAYISKIEARGEIPSPSVIIELSKVLEVEPEMLFEVAKKEKADGLAKIATKKYDDALFHYRMKLCIQQKGGSEK
jgi:transcriptional regulator with XRE-family HTH domain